MELTFLGTGAADFAKDLCEPSMKKLDKNIRRSSALLLNRNLLIDCGPHLCDELELCQIDPCGIEHILLTHEHGDHFSVQSLGELAIRKGGPIYLWHSEQIDLPQVDGVIFCPLAAEQTYEIGGCLVTPLGANHTRGALHFSLESEGKKLFYGCDGAWLLMPTYYYMKNKAYDVMVMDATVGDYEGDYRMAEHNSIPMIRMMKKSFLTYGIATDTTKIILSHLARTLHKPYEQTCMLVKDDGFTVAYDGMVLNF